MSELLVVLAVVMAMVLVVAIAFGLLVGFAAWSLTRRNRLAPDLETGAPLTWLWSPTHPARLHRRLQRAVAPIHQPAPTGRRRHAGHRSDEPTAVGPTGSIDDVCRSLTGQAMAVDREVVQAARLPRRYRRRQLRLLQTEVADIERLTVRVHRHRADQARPATIGDEPTSRSEAFDRLDRHLDGLADAHAELQAIERANGLDDPERILGAIDAGQRQPIPTSTEPAGPTRPASTDRA